MARFISPETSRRNRFADSVITGAGEILATHSVKEALGHQAAESMNLLEQLYVPNQQDGVYISPRPYRDLGIPYIPTNQRLVRVQTDALGIIHPQQVESLQEETARDSGTDISDGDADLIRQILQQSIASTRGDTLRFQRIRGVGSVRCVVGRIGTISGGVHRAYDVASRPLLMQRQLWKTPTALSHRELTLLHELVHVNQKLKNPVYSDDPDATLKRRVSEEFEAYQMEVRVGVALYGRLAMNLMYPSLMKIESKRLSENGSTDDYTANERLIKFAQKKKLI